MGAWGAVKRQELRRVHWETVTVKKNLRSWGCGQKKKLFKACIAWLSESYHLQKFVFLHPSPSVTIFSEPQAVSIWSITSLTFPKNSTILRSNSAMFDVKMLVTCQVVRACKSACLINEGSTKLSREQLHRASSNCCAAGTPTSPGLPLAVWFLFLIYFISNVYNKLQRSCLTIYLPIQFANLIYPFKCTNLIYLLHLAIYFSNLIYPLKCTNLIYPFLPI